ncbi:blue (type1) copper domain-containing protein [Candidatus Nitrosopumilus koreensis AR1]|uniref:Blue (Type1) copper domain-containing protein n=1 Tax=Candidatus Nitrosopumilus koreensis AR1 TaxID=1229908 RepID=K0B930_9ARCH|nr:MULTISPECIES: PEFG-CTERM sorting domain-containing protein [Nitrosopumilus]AFS81460.1 blue (type1) copper domain-containing protein [Candidatus Nitrosopumilus koreensis AR1]
MATKKNPGQKILCFSILLVTIFAVANFHTFAFAEETVSSKAELSIGANHLGSMIETQTVSEDGSVWIFVTASEPVEREHMTINVRFTDKNGKELVDVNYDILASQNNEVILYETMINQQMGIRNHLTQALPSNDNVSITITLHHVGSSSMIISNGESIDVNIVPEFGTIAMMILVVSITSVIVIGAKNKMVFKSFTSS